VRKPTIQRRTSPLGKGELLLFRGTFSAMDVGILLEGNRIKKEVEPRSHRKKHFLSADKNIRYEGYLKVPPGGALPEFLSHCRQKKRDANPQGEAPRRRRIREVERRKKGARTPRAENEAPRAPYGRTEMSSFSAGGKKQKCPQVRKPGIGFPREIASFSGVTSGFSEHTRSQSGRRN